MANSLYETGRNAFLKGEIDYLSDTIKMALMSNLYAPDLSNDVYFNQISSFVLGTPQTLSNKTASAGVADCDDIVFPAIVAGSTISYILIYKDTGYDAASQLIAVFDSVFGLPFATNGSTITITIDSGSNKLFIL